MAPSSSEGKERKKKSRKEAKILFVYSQVDLIDGPSDFIAIIDLLAMLPTHPARVCVAHTHTRTQDSGSCPSLISSSWASLTAVSTLRQRRAGASVSGECASMSRRGCALGAGSAASRVPRLQEAESGRDHSSPPLPRPEPDLGARAVLRGQQGRTRRTAGPTCQR